MRPLPHATQDVFADRATDERANKLSRMSLQRGSQQVGRIVKIDLDGMDQAKFMIPRNTPSTKAHEGLWKPQLHLVGVIVHGIAEMYFGMDTDIVKGSVTQITILCRALDHVATILAEAGDTMPPHIVFHAAPP